VSLASGEIAKPVYLQFDDNRLLPLLFGEHDQNLARIERNLFGPERRGIAGEDELLDVDLVGDDIA